MRINEGTICRLALLALHLFLVFLPSEFAALVSQEVTLWTDWPVWELQAHSQPDGTHTAAKNSCFMQGHSYYMCKASLQPTSPSLQWHFLMVINTTISFACCCNKTQIWEQTGYFPLSITERWRHSHLNPMMIFGQVLKHSQLLPSNITVLWTMIPWCLRGCRLERQYITVNEVTLYCAQIQTLKKPMTFLSNIRSLFSWWSTLRSMAFSASAHHLCIH